MTFPAPAPLLLGNERQASQPGKQVSLPTASVDEDSTMPSHLVHWNLERAFLLGNQNSQTSKTQGCRNGKRTLCVWLLRGHSYLYAGIPSPVYSESSPAHRAIQPKHMLRLLKFRISVFQIATGITAESSVVNPTISSGISEATSYRTP